MQQIYRRNFIDIALPHGCSPVNFAAYFQNTFYQEELWMATSVSVNTMEWKLRKRNLVAIKKKKYEKLSALFAYGCWNVANVEIFVCSIFKFMKFYFCYIFHSYDIYFIIYLLYIYMYTICFLILLYISVFTLLDFKFVW